MLGWMSGHLRAFLGFKTHRLGSPVGRVLRVPSSRGFGGPWGAQKYVSCRPPGASIWRPAPGKQKKLQAHDQRRYAQCGDQEAEAVVGRVAEGS